MQQCVTGKEDDKRMTLEQLATQYRDEAEAIGQRLSELRRQYGANPDNETEKRIALLRTMRRENLDTYRHLLWYIGGSI